jgi:hypothetical protein
MHIELPSPTWADVHRAQDDAHTLTLPQQRPVTLSQAFLLAEGGETQRVRVAPTEPGEMTLTL